MLGTGLTSRQLQVDPQEEREQITERDQRVQEEQKLDISAGSSAEPISHPHLQEPVAPATIQLQRYVNKVCTMELDMLIQRTARPEPPKALPLRETDAAETPRVFPRERGLWALTTIF